MNDRLTLSRVVRTWWPLALSWGLMSAEPSAIAAVVARMAHPEINLAAYGSVSFAINGLIMAPLISLLSLSTSITRDRATYQVGRRLMNYMGIAITIIYGLVAFTPLFDLIVKYLMGAPAEIIEPARASLMFGLPWSYAVGYRRFNQGVLIRFNHSRDVSMGTLTRFVADALVLAIGYLTALPTGAILATLVMVAGVNTDALYVHFRVKKVLQQEVPAVEPGIKPVSMRSLLTLFLPLALTPLLNQLVRPIGSAALSRLPDPVTALAIWPVINSFAWLLVTPASALNETVNALIDLPSARRPLLGFILGVMGVETAFMALLAASGFAASWFHQVSGLDAVKSQIAGHAFWLLVPLGILAPLGAWFSGAIIYSRKTRGITEGMVVYLASFTLALTVGSAVLPVNGLYIVTGASTLSSGMQTLWLWWRSRRVLQQIQ